MAILLGSLMMDLGLSFVKDEASLSPSLGRLAAGGVGVGGISSGLNRPDSSNLDTFLLSGVVSVLELMGGTEEALLTLSETSERG